MSTPEWLHVLFTDDEPSAEFKAIVDEMVAQYLATLNALAAHDAGATDEEIQEILLAPSSNTPPTGNLPPFIALHPHPNPRTP